MQVTEQELRVFSRLKQNQDGIDLFEILLNQLAQNHMILLEGKKDYRDEMIGYGACLLDITRLFKECDDKLKRYSVKDSQDRF